MKQFLMTISFIGLLLQAPRSQSINYKDYPVYAGNDLGLTYTNSQSSFRIWAPAALTVDLLLYKEGEGGVAEKVRMQRAEQGTWKATVKGNLAGRFYTFKVTGKEKDGGYAQGYDEVPDPYAKAVGVNGKRAMVIDLKTTNPAGWATDKSPAFNNKTSAIIYELHVRDASIAGNSGIKQKGKFAGLTERGTTNTKGLSTGLDHIRELGVTHVHLLPFYDFNSVDESKNAVVRYNWGYDPLNYNTPEGSYSSNAYDGAIRVKEFKQLVKTFHENGLRVVMDVVYNHTALTERSNFNQLVPGYYYRQTADGKFSNATACGNETASERPMMRKFILESMKYWVQEFHIDGFRIDLMGVHDIATMNLVSKELHKIRPDILLYGEGWTAGSSPLPDSLRALKNNAAKLDRIAVFSDDIRDGIKGSVFNHEEKGFASGRPGMEESIKFGVVASCPHPQVNYEKVNYSKAPYSREPWQTITYAECHDNHALWDKLSISAKGATRDQLVDMHKLSLAIVLTSQGIPFLHAGTEFLRGKKGVENSFESADSINAIDWDLKTENKEVVDYVKQLIALRKKYPEFRMASGKHIRENIRFIDNTPAGVVAYIINDKSTNKTGNTILVMFNGTNKMQNIPTPAGWEWEWLLNDYGGGIGTVPVSPSLKGYSCGIMIRGAKLNR
jgi:pullulanase